MDTMEFITKAQLKHGQRYQYTRANYSGSRVAVIVTCRLHGDFAVKPEYHLRGQHCKKCAVVTAHRSRAHSVYAKLIDRFKVVHGSTYDYSGVVYRGWHVPVAITCQTHGVFNQRIGNHLSGMGCPECGKIKNANAATKSTLQFVSDAIRLHGNKYGYAEVAYVHSKQKVAIRCPIHGVFFQVPYVHLAGKGCPSCSSAASKMESAVAAWCSSRGMAYEREVTIKEFNKYKRFDFYFPVLNCYVELDGLFHWSPVFGKNRLEQQKLRDAAADQWCKHNGVKLYRFTSANDCVNFLRSTLC